MALSREYESREGLCRRAWIFVIWIVACARRCLIGRSNGPTGETSDSAAQLSKGELIRARIAANAKRRLEIAEAMKTEAGVDSHLLNLENLGGRARTDAPQIFAPPGKNRDQLVTLAHECGHIFLHRLGTPGYNLPPHVQEMEAESYAHQAFRVHGMRVPAAQAAWGRSYIGDWIRKDRRAGIRIDPRAVAFAKGERSPFEPLRFVPETWKATGIVGEQQTAGFRHQGAAIGRSLHVHVDPNINRTEWDVSRWCRYAFDKATNGFLAGLFIVLTGWNWGCPTDWCAAKDELPSLGQLAFAVSIALIWANVAVLKQTYLEASLKLDGAGSRPR